ncbi:MAG: hypothetical protein C5B49_10715 [Bdellovibrio sp.]|nr:MAG: hypothetical protein C5B49_10715 [Bdellovibrio sp.]
MKIGIVKIGIVSTVLIAIALALGFQNCGGNGATQGSQSASLSVSGNGGGYAGLAKGTYYRISETGSLHITAQLNVTDTSIQFQDLVNPSNNHNLAASEITIPGGDNRVASVTSQLFQYIQGPVIFTGGNGIGGTVNGTISSAMEATCINPTAADQTPVVQAFLPSDGQRFVDILVSNPSYQAMPPGWPSLPNLMPLNSYNVTRSDAATSRTYSGAGFSLVIDLSTLSSNAEASATVQFTNQGQTVNANLDCYLDQGP